MGMNFYAVTKEDCPCCGASGQQLHIGKSSLGWAFALHVYPDLGIDNLEDWKTYLLENNFPIVDEGGSEVSFEYLLDRITNRSHPKGLQRFPIDGRYCIGHGEGTYDYLISDFC